MADDRHYIGGDHYMLDDLSGMKIRRSRAVMIPGGQTGNLWVAPRRWEPQQPQDFVTGVRDEITVDVARPRQVNRFVITGTYVTAPSPAQSTSITVDSSVGFAAGSMVQIMLDSGENFLTDILFVSGKVWTLLKPLPASVGSLYGDPIENSILLLGTSPVAGVFVLDSASGILDVNVLA